MPSRYTDVDRMLLKRWDEVIALTEAFGHLLDRINDVVQASMQKASMAAAERGWLSESDAKRATMSFWRPEWASRRNEAGVYVQLIDFVPAQCARDVGDHPSAWLMTDEWSKLRMRETAEEFGRAVRRALSPDVVEKWSHEDAVLAESPLGRQWSEITEADRVRFVSEPDALVAFVTERLEEFAELLPGIEQALQKMTRR